ncbi:restriction endonuclease [Nocardiopsis sp. HNM0947]|uniref:Restriction endonuclease n=2 Tax=Nocardiopsis coralli TaxID=2772213 RepID=A0ABR9PC16_9ACTN|nr:restriction endonuclease [Nocardiopsis coralli]
MPVPEGFPHAFQLVYRREPRELVVDYEFPTEEVVPATRSYKYVQTREETDAKPRPPKEIKALYASVLAQTALKVLRYAFSVKAPEVLDRVVFNGFVQSADPATGRPSKPYLLAVSSDRETFDSLVLSDLDPVTCVKQQLGARVSPHPGDHEPVRPMVDFEALLEQFRFVDGVDAPTDLDGRTDLLELSANEFEHLVRQLFEGIGMQSWVTQASKDDGVDAVATNEDPIVGGLCVIQAKRYSRAVGVAAVRELAGTMEDKHASKGIMVTTSWVTKGGHDHARRHGRMQIIEYDNLIHMLKAHLGMDVIISLPKKPPPR